ncbi:MAG TPA: FAD-dependent oxidoreductase [Propionibacteriaceae bacterium]|nr:FAD-dependent oxidoreductase [Propionibacteriaceae bacterium]
MIDPVVVIGGGVAGLAAAARLAKVGHRVELYEGSETLGGTWAPYRLANGVMVDDAPSIIGFPAPWRDLFRKSGRPLEAELARMGYALGPARPATMIFADGAELTLPTDRGGQYATLAAAYGSSVAERWRALLDRLDLVWQTLRGLGIEAELRSRRQLNRSVRRTLFGHRMTLADLATSIDHDHLSALIRSIAYRSGSVPEQTPAFAAVELSLQRTFGRWQVLPLDTDSRLDVGRSSVLVEALAARLELRKVRVHLGCPVESIELRGGHVTAVVTSDGDRPAASVIATCDPWQTFNDLLPITADRQTRRQLRKLGQAAAPAITHHEAPEPTAPLQETVALGAAGVPSVNYVRRLAGNRLRTTHDFNAPLPKPSYGAAWSGFASLLRRPSVTTKIPGLYTASPSSPAGPGASQVVLSAALAAYSCHDHLKAKA